MIVDRIENASQYYGLGEGIKKGLRYLADTDFSVMEPGRYELDGDKVYVMVQEYNTKSMDMGRWEGHKKYIDIQYICNGQELIGYANVWGMKVEQEYSETKDIMFFTGEGDLIKMPHGSFMILYPEDIHMPCMTESESNPVKKIVLKVLVEI